MADAVLVKTEGAVEKLINLARRQRNGEPDWLKDLRGRALEEFQEKGFPSRKIEAWRDTDLRRLNEMDFQPSGRASSEVTPEELSGLRFASLDGPRMVFVNGLFAEELSNLSDIPGGVTMARLSESLASHDAVSANLGRYSKWQERSFDALNLAMFDEGALIEVESRVEVEKPLHVVFLNRAEDESKAFAVNPRILAIVGESSKVKIVESHLGLSEGGYFSNAATEIVAGKNANVDHHKIQLESEAAVHLGSFESTQERDSSVRNTLITLGGALIRNDTGSTLGGEGGCSELNGLYLVGKDHHVDNFTRIGHERAHCDSREVYKGILADQAKAVFRGRIVVAEGAQKTDSKQTNKNLLLTDRAVVNTKPQLEIYADDVKCTHGATVGQLDSDAIFYLRARGISEEDARAILIYAFASELINAVSIQQLREELDEYLLEWLPNYV
jgi:Fe-S cluster assembly protein SufD